MTRTWSPALVSAIVPAHNHERFVAETLESLIAQAHPAVELIVVDDGSTDSTPQEIEAVLPRCKARFRRVLFLDQPHRGLIPTLKRGLSAALGDYLYMIASDDRAPSHAVTTLVEFLESHPDYGLAVGDNAIIDERGRRCYWDCHRNNVYRLAGAEFRTFMEFLRWIRPATNLDSPSFGQYSHLLIGNHVPNGYLIRRTDLDRTGGLSDHALLHDYYLMLQLSKVTKLKYLDRILFEYRWHGSNSSRQSRTVAHQAIATLLVEGTQSIDVGRWRHCLLDRLSLYAQRHSSADCVSMLRGLLDSGEQLAAALAVLDPLRPDPESLVDGLSDFEILRSGGGP